MRPSPMPAAMAQHTPLALRGPQAQARQTSHRQPATRSSDDGYTTTSSITLVHPDGEDAGPAVLGQKSLCVVLAWSDPHEVVI